ncbi:unnamed protein product [Musa hybrid cultivar]
MAPPRPPSPVPPPRPPPPLLPGTIRFDGGDVQRRGGGAWGVLAATGQDGIRSMSQLQRVVRCGGRGRCAGRSPEVLSPGGRLRRAQLAAEPDHRCGGNRSRSRRAARRARPLSQRGVLVAEKQTPLHVYPAWIRSRHMKRLNREGVLLLSGLDSRLSKNFPPVLSKIRCKVTTAPSRVCPQTYSVAFHALRFSAPIGELGNKLA